MKQKHTKYTQINTNESTQSKMGPVWQNPIQRTVRTAHLSVLMTVHSFTSYIQTNIIAQMLSIEGEGQVSKVICFFKCWGKIFK